jgi:hypothetical protein
MMPESVVPDKDKEASPPEPAGEVKMSPEERDSQEKTLDLGRAADLVKNVGVVIGGLGSLAVLLFWIGNAIIVARRLPMGARNA